MIQRITFLFVFLFWVTMNVLLWRAEYGSANREGSEVPPEMVWEKMLTAPDSSGLNVVRAGHRIGFCRWATSVSEQLARFNEAPTSSQLSRAYFGHIRFEGSLNLPDAGGRFHFSCELQLTNGNQWQQFDARLRLRPVTMELSAGTGSRIVHVSMNDGFDSFERKLTFDQLRNPMVLIGLLTGSDSGDSFVGLPLTKLTTPSSEPAAQVAWDAHLDALKIGHEPVRVYRLHTRLFGRYDVTIYVSRAGEIFRVELPDGIVLLHDRLSAM